MGVFMDISIYVAFSCQVMDLEDDVQGLWRMRDKPDFSEDDRPPLKKEIRIMKKSSNNKYGKEKGFLAPGFSRIEYSDAQSIGSLTGDDKDEDVQSRCNGEPETARLIDEVWPVDRT
nr:hypothetical protein [Tanacetum cinerariifolium]